MPELYTFDDREIRSDRVFHRVSRLVEVEIIIDSTGLPPEDPVENRLEIVDESGMPRGFPHQILLGGVSVVVVLYLFEVSGHGVPLSGNEQLTDISYVPQRIYLSDWYQVISILPYVQSAYKERCRVDSANVVFTRSCLTL